MPSSYANYHVGLKVLLRKGDEVLFLHDVARPLGSDQWVDFPGGRIDESEREIELEDILKREISEELGDGIKYSDLRLAFASRRYIEHTGAHILILFYEAKYLNGEIKLSDEHLDYHWIDAGSKTLKASDFICEDEYQAFSEYFQSTRQPAVY